MSSKRNDGDIGMDAAKWANRSVNEMLETAQVFCHWEHFGSVSGKILHNSESQFLWVESCALYMASKVLVSAVLFGSKFGVHDYNYSKAISTFEKKKYDLNVFL